MGRGQHEQVAARRGPGKPGGTRQAPTNPGAAERAGPAGPGMAEPARARPGAARPGRAREVPVWGLPVGRSASPIPGRSRRAARWHPVLPGAEPVVGPWAGSVLRESVGWSSSSALVGGVVPGGRGYPALRPADTGRVSARLTTSQHRTGPGAPNANTLPRDSSPALPPAATQRAQAHPTGTARGTLPPACTSAALVPPPHPQAGAGSPQAPRLALPFRTPVRRTPTTAGPRSALRTGSGTAGPLSPALRCSAGRCATASVCGGS